MGRQVARKVVETDAEEPRAPQAFSTGEYRFFRDADEPHAGASVTGVHLPLSSGGWLVPLLAVAAIATLTYFLLQ